MRKRSLAPFCLLLLLVASQSSHASPAKRSRAKGQNAQAASVKISRVATFNFAELAEREARTQVARRPYSVPEPREEEEASRPRPVPPDAVVIRDGASAASAPKTLASQQALGSAPTPAATFQGAQANFIYPPDTQGAVGPEHLLVAVNDFVLVQSKTGENLRSVPLTSFFPGSGFFIFDPRVQYDPYGKRWIVIAAADFYTATSSIVLAVSQTSDPLGNWNVYRFDADPADLHWADYPMLGFNKDWIVVTANLFPMSNDPAASFHSRVYIVDKAAAYAGASANLSVRAARSSDGIMITPASTFDPNLSTLYLLQVHNGNLGGSGYLRLYTITGPVGAEVFDNAAPGVFVSAPEPWSDFAGYENFGPQLGTKARVELDHGVVENLVYRNGSLWCAHTVYLPADTPTHSAVQWWQFDPSNRVVQQRGRIEDEGGELFYAYPSLAVNKNNDVLVGYSRFKATEYGSAGYSYRASTDAPGVMRDGAVLKAGETSYGSENRSARNRWGDYSAAAVDPANETDMWTLQEYASISNLWGTWWGRFSGGAVPACTYTISPPLQSFTAEGGAGSVSVSAPAGCAWTASSGSPFLSVTGGASGAGDGTVSFAVGVSDNSQSRAGTLTVAGHAFTVAQYGAAVRLDSDALGVNESARKILVNITRAGGTDSEASVTYDTFEGTARKQTDYTEAHGTLVFAPGEKTKTVTVFITDDAYAEQPETFTFAITGASGVGLVSPDRATVTINSDDAADGQSPVGDAAFDVNFFVRQHYVDFLGREADADGLAFWTGEITKCGPDLQCREVKRINVSAAFFLSIEFQNTGYFSYRVRKAAFGDADSPGVAGTVPVTVLQKFLADTQRLGRGVVVGQGEWQKQLEANKRAFLLEFVQSPEFEAAYPSYYPPELYVDLLRFNTGAALSQAERDQLVAELKADNNTPEGRAAVLGKVAEDADLSKAELNRAFVLMQYFGYLRRDPNNDPEPTHNFAGWRFWLSKLEQFHGNYIEAEMVKAFISSDEYRKRFGQ